MSLCMDFQTPTETASHEIFVAYTYRRSRKRDRYTSIGKDFGVHPLALAMLPSAPP
jgi:hypothetical protein